MASKSENVRDAAYRLGIVTGRREVTELLVGDIRRRLTEWRAADSNPQGGLRARAAAALRWSVTELWGARLSKFAQELEAQVIQLRRQEQGMRADLEKVEAETKRWWRR